MKLLIISLLFIGIVNAKDFCFLPSLPGEIICSHIVADTFPIREVLTFEEDIPGFTISLRRLEVFDSKINSISKNTFKLLPKITHIALSNISLETIDVAAFQGVTRLKSVDLSHNKLTKLDRDLFKGIVLLHLRLDGNHNLEKPTNGPIIYAKFLNSLSLKDCDISHLPGSAFLGTPDLKSLVLSHNDLEQLPVDIFRTLSLNYLDLSHNRFKTINPQVFERINGYPKLPSAVILNGNKWNCDCAIDSFIAWVTQDTETHFPTTNLDRSRLKKETICASPLDRQGHSWTRYQEWNCHQQRKP